MPVSKTRVLVVEDSLTVRRYLVDVINRDPALEVVGEAEDGKRAIELCLSLRPDVITLDMVLPVMSGLGATEYIMAHRPTPILIVSASVNRRELFHTYDALAAGAVEVFDKPGDESHRADWDERFVAMVKRVARIKVITHLRGRIKPSLGVRGLATPSHTAHVVTDTVRLVAIGASTGGPGALVSLLRDLPKDFPIPLVIVIHLSPTFGPALAEWLDTMSPLCVRLATDGVALPTTGTVLLAPPDRHLVVEHERLRLTQDGERHSCRPSVDVLFESCAQAYGKRTIGCLLTGMGRDGATGLLAIRQAGGLTIAQDEASSVIYGMPREAARIGAAEVILSLDAIAPRLVESTLAARNRGDA